MTSSDRTTSSSDPTADEVARLQEEIAALKASKSQPAPVGRRGWWRPVVAGALVALATLIAPLSVLSTWASGQIQDTDRYLATVGPLASHPDIQEAVATRMEQVIFSYLDVEAVVGLALIGAAVAIARDRRRMVLVSGLAVAGSMVLLGATLNAIRPFYLDALPASSSAAAAGAVYDQLVSFIRVALRAVLVVALTVAVVAWFSASRGPGAAARAGLVRGIGLLRRGTARTGLQTGRFGVLLAEYRSPISVVVVGLAAVGYLMQDHPTSGTALTFVLVTAAVLLVLAVLAADDAEPEEALAPTTSP